nr:hypothetical protein [Desulfobacterales bacterium]
MEDKIHGVSAMRTPRGPNPIGLSEVRLMRREGRILHIAEVGVLNETLYETLSHWFLVSITEIV